MRASLSAIACSLLALAGHSTASPLEQRQASSSSSTTAPTAALLQTSISGTLATVTVGAPSSVKSVQASVSATASITASDSVTGTTSAGSIDPTASNAPLCSNPSTGPFCLPRTNTTVNPGQTYWITWDPTLFAINTTVTVALNYDNNSNVAAWTSEGMPRERSFVTVTMDKEWMQGSSAANLSFIMIAYSPSSDHVARPLDGPFVTLTTPGYAAPPPTKMPDTHSLVIGLPVALGSMIIIIVALYFGMRGHRSIDVKSLLKRGSRRRGYGVGKSRRQRMGTSKKGAIRLEEREIMEEEGIVYRDEPRAASPPVIPMQMQEEPEEVHEEKPKFPTHAREESLGSLVADEEEERPKKLVETEVAEERPNAFRRELKQQNMGRKESLRRKVSPTRAMGGSLAAASRMYNNKPVS